MKKINLILIFLLIFSHIVLATGQTVNIDHLPLNTPQSIGITTKDRIAFDLLNGSHTIIIDKIQNNSIDLAIFPYLKNVFYITLQKETYIKIDLNKDFYIDLIMRLEGTKGNNAIIYLTRVNIDERTKNMKDNNLTEPYKFKNNSTNVTINIDPNLNQTNPWKGILIIVSILIVGIGVYYLFKRK